MTASVVRKTPVFMSNVVLNSLHGITLTNLSVEDIPAFQRLLYSIIEELHPGSPWLEAMNTQYSHEVIRHFITTSSACLPVVYNQLGEMVALAIGPYEGGLGAVRWIAVRRDYRNRLLGTELLNHLIRFFRDAGCYQVELRSYMHNQRLLRFYSRFGFRLIALQPRYKFDNDLAYMMLDLGN